jgi:hypothetical protein
MTQVTDEVFTGISIVDDEAFPFDKTLTYYLAGPMSGYPEYNFAEFNVACAMLRSVGINVMSPHEIDHGETPETRGSLPYKTYIDAGLALLKKCQGIILLRGWPQSSGACNELELAIDHAMPIYFFHYVDVMGQLISMNRRPPA